MHISGFLVVARPAECRSCARDLDALPGVEVHYCYADQGRIIAVQETATVEDQQEGLRRIQALPRVLMAALVEHRIEPEEARSEPSNLREPS